MPSAPRPPALHRPLGYRRLRALPRSAGVGAALDGRDDGSEYVIVAQDHFWEMRLVVFARRRTLAARVRRTEVAHVGTGVGDVLGFEFFEPPDADQLAEALLLLHALAALDGERGALTRLGDKMVELE